MNDLREKRNGIINRDFREDKKGREAIGRLGHSWKSIYKGSIMRLKVDAEWVLCLLIDTLNKILDINKDDVYVQSGSRPICQSKLCIREEAEWKGKHIQ